MDLYPGRWKALLIRLCGPGCECPSPGKSPHVEGASWPQHALQRFHDWSAALGERCAEVCRTHVRRGGNLGLALPPHVLALDVDTDLQGGSDYATAGRARHAIESLLDGHPVQESGKLVSGERVGVHVFGQIADRRAFGTHYGNVPVTIRGVGNQVVVAPSLHASGARYQWLRELPEDPLYLPEVKPEQFRHEHRASGMALRRGSFESSEQWRARVSQAWCAELEDPSVVFPEGRRHDALLWLAWHLTVCGCDPDEVDAACWDLAQHRCAHGGRFDARSRALSREIRGLVRDSRKTLEIRGLE